MWFRDIVFNKLGLWIIPLLLLGLAILGLVFYPLAVGFFETFYFHNLGTGEVPEVSLITPQSYTHLSLISAIFYCMIVGGGFAAILGTTLAVIFSEFTSDKGVQFYKNIGNLLSSVPPIAYGILVVLVGQEILEINNPLLNSLFGSIVITLMILPKFTNYVFEILQKINGDMREGAFSLGANRFQVAFWILVPANIGKITAAFLLTFGRVLSETLIVALASGLIIEKYQTLVVIFVVSFIFYAFSLFSKKLTND